MSEEKTIYIAEYTSGRPRLMKVVATESDKRWNLTGDKDSIVGGGIFRSVINKSDKSLGVFDNAMDAAKYLIEKSEQYIAVRRDDITRAESHIAPLITIVNQAKTKGRL